MQIKDHRNPGRGTAGGRRLRMANMFAVLGAGLVAACSTDIYSPPPALPPNELYTALVVSQHALNLSTEAPYDTVQLTATPMNALGQPMSGVGTATFTSGDLDNVQVTPDGLVTAAGPAFGVPVVATLTNGDITHVDTAMVNVSAGPTPAPLAQFQLTQPPASVFFWPGMMSTNATDADGNPEFGLAVYYQSSDPTVAQIDHWSGVFSPNGARPGHVTIYASTMAYGVAGTDSMQVAIPFPGIEGVVVDSVTGAFAPKAIVIRTGGVVMWFAHNPSNIIFDDSTDVAEDPFICQCGGGNIQSFGPGLVSRMFPTPGTYKYHSTVTDSSGVIIVTDSTSVPPGVLNASLAAYRTALAILNDTHTP